MLGSGNALSRGNATLSPEMALLPQYLQLEPITLGNQKYTRSGELRRVLGVPLGSTSEDHSFGAIHHKPPPPVATEELKHYKESVQGTVRMARDRVKKLRDSIVKLDQYKEALNSKKRQRSDVTSIERLGGANFVKTGSQKFRNPQDIVTQRLEDRMKNGGLNKRSRTSAADLRVDGRAAAAPKQIEGDVLPAVIDATARMDEKIHRLPVGGEGWDTKMKKKRSVGAVGSRVIKAERDIKRPMQLKLGSESKLRSCDVQAFRNELESPAAARERITVMEQRALTKGNNKSSVQGDNSGITNTSMKGKASRAPRTGSIMVLDSSSKVHSPSGAFQGWEQSTGVNNKVSGLGLTNTQRRPISATSPSHAMAQWVGQRTHKTSRTRRANLVSPVSNNEPLVPSQGFATSDLSARTSSFGTNGSLHASSRDGDTPKSKEFENVSSPFGLSESEESGGGENKLKEKLIDSGDGSLTVTHKGSFILPRKNKIPTNENDGVRRKGRSGNVSSLMRSSIQSIREKSEILQSAKPLQINTPISDKQKSKTGRPHTKKLKDRKASIRVGPIQNNVTSGFTAESDDDLEELYAAAHSARNASNLACSGPFWKKMESVFSSPSSEDVSFLKQQLTSAEELDQRLSQISGAEYDLLGLLVLKEVPDRSGESLESHQVQENAKTDAIHGQHDKGGLDKVTPLYQRVLSALIEEDEVEEIYHDCEGKNLSLHYASDDSYCGSCNPIDVEPKDRERMESDVESEADLWSHKNNFQDRISCDKSAASNTCKNLSMSSSFFSNELLGEDDFSHSDTRLVSEICSSDLAQQQHRQANVSCFSSNCEYKLMCLDERLILELQSVGLYPEALPGLAEGEEAIKQEVTELKEGLSQQIGKKKRSLRKMEKAIQKGRDIERRNLELCAMDQLIQMAYRKRMASRGSHSSKGATRKVSKHVALAFIKRTLARCRKFEDMGRSCFSEPALHDILFSSLDAKSQDGVGSGTGSNEASNHQMEIRGSATGAVSSSFNVYNNTEGDTLDRSRFVGSASSRVTSTLENVTVGGARGKRSERRDKNADGSKSERKTKSKSKQKNGRTEIHPKSPKVESQDDFASELDTVGLGGHNDLEFNGQQDFGSWLKNINIDEDGLQDDHDFTNGFDIPMDDLSFMMQ